MANAGAKKWDTLMGLEYAGKQYDIPYTNDLAPVLQKLPSAIHWINHYTLDSAISFPNTYPLDRDLSS